MTTAYCYDPLYLEHASPGHPERPERLTSLMQVLEDEGVLPRLQRVQPTPAPRGAIEQVHTKEYIDHIKSIAEQGSGWLDMDTYVGRRSFDAALLATGGLLNLVDAVLQGTVSNGFALIRPPGHHAGPNQGMGFCLLNNVAVAAKVALNDFGLRRVLIVDWDVHHGNGTQDSFYAHRDVLFFSVHQYPFYPGTGNWRETGDGAGEGYTVNVPVPAGVGEATYLQAFEKILAPVARRFSPDLILVSAGYDAHWRDPLAGVQLTVASFAELARRVQTLAAELCEGRWLCTLEGGYDEEVLAYGTLATVKILLGDEDALPDPIGSCQLLESSADNILAQVKQAHQL